MSSRRRSVSSRRRSMSSSNCTRERNTIMEGKTGKRGEGGAPSSEIPEMANLANGSFYLLTSDQDLIPGN